MIWKKKNKVIPIKENTITLKEIDLPFQMDSGAPEPELKVSNYEFELTYNLIDDSGKAKLKFDNVIQHTFGFPNDEALPGHRYYTFGLKYYAMIEVLNSDIIEKIKKENSVHPRHNDKMYDSYRHFIFTFHDSTLELIAKDFSFEKIIT